MDVIKIYSNACCHSENFLSDILISTRKTNAALDTTQAICVSRMLLMGTPHLAGSWHLPKHQCYCFSADFAEDVQGEMEQFMVKTRRADVTNISIFLLQWHVDLLCVQGKRNEIVNYYEGGEICSHGLLRALVRRKRTSRKLTATEL